MLILQYVPGRESRLRHLLRLLAPRGRAPRPVLQGAPLSQRCGAIGSCAPRCQGSIHAVDLKMMDEPVIAMKKKWGNLGFYSFLNLMGKWLGFEATAMENIGKSYA